jgi:glycosyltransferase involved in cell wall biosynthesis
VKNLAGAIRTTAAAGVHLKIAGGNRPFLPRLSCLVRRNREWIGPVNGEYKAKLLAEARALIFPVAWPEPFGLVVAEALISGTPVLATRRGSLPELIPSDVGGFFDTDEEWIEFLRKGIVPWEPERCREWALSQFHYATMAEAYERAYQQVIAGELLNQEFPLGGNWRIQ